MNYDDLKYSVEAMSGGKNTVILDDLGKPSVMVAVPKLKYSDIIDGGANEILPVFKVDGQEVNHLYISKYQNIVVDDRAYSMAGQDPRTSIDFDTALQACRNKGGNWCLAPDALFGAIVGWCAKNGFMPHGNSNYGADYSNPHEKGICSYSDNGVRTCRTATGSGPATWYHDGTDSGIADLCGNVWEWGAGMRLVDGEIQIIPDGNCMKPDCDMSATSTEWKAIMPDGTLVATGTEGTLKYDWNGANGSTGSINTTLTNQTNDSTYAYLAKFSTLTAATGVNVPDILKAYSLAPIANREYGNGAFWHRNYGERVPLRGAHFNDGSNAGLPALILTDPRSRVGWHVGFRSVYYQLPSA